MIRNEIQQHVLRATTPPASLSNLRRLLSMPQPPLLTRRGITRRPPTNFNSLTLLRAALQQKPRNRVHNLRLIPLDDMPRAFDDHHLGIRDQLPPSLSLLHGNQPIFIAPDDQG